MSVYGNEKTWGDETERFLAPQNPKEKPMKRMIIQLLGLFLAMGQFTSCSAEKVPDKSQSSDSNEPLSYETDPIVTSPEQAAAEHLMPVKYFSQRWEWDNEILLAVSEYSSVTLNEESTQRYPALAEALVQTKNMEVRAMETEFENLLSTAKVELAHLGADSFVTKSSTRDVQIRRADSVAVSLLSDSFLVYGNINDRYLNGTTYDTATGETLTITDIITDMSKIPAIVKKELTSHTWTGDFFSDTAVEDYFRDIPDDGIVWTLDYYGVTFYFGNGDLAEIGRHEYLAATVSFAEYPGLFNEKYMTAPDAYIVELPITHPFYTDLDSDGTSEALQVAPVPDEGGLCYKAFEIHTDTDMQYYREDFPAVTAHRTGGYHPYYIKTADGRHYLYVFAEGSDAASSDMKLRVMDITGAGFRVVGDVHIAPGYVPIDGSWALTDPDNMMLENFETQQEAAAYRVGNDGLPELK